MLRRTNSRVPRYNVTVGITCHWATMKLPAPLIEATPADRYKRFLAEAAMRNGEAVTVHCPNTGAVHKLNEPPLPAEKRTRCGTQDRNLDALTSLR